MTCRPNDLGACMQEVTLGNNGERSLGNNWEIIIGNNWEIILGNNLEIILGNNWDDDCVKLCDQPVHLSALQLHFSAGVRHHQVERFYY